MNLWQNRSNRSAYAGKEHKVKRQKGVTAKPRHQPEIFQRLMEWKQKSPPDRGDRAGLDEEAGMSMSL